MTDNSILTVTEAAALLKVPATTVRVWAKDGKIPARKIGKHWRFSEGDIRAWLRENYSPTQRQ